MHDDPSTAPVRAARRRSRPGVRPRAAGALLLLGTLAVLAGCAATSGVGSPAAPPPADGVPGDLELEVLLMEGRGRRVARTFEREQRRAAAAVDDDADALGPPREPGRWIALADGAFHHFVPDERDVRETGVHPARRDAPRLRVLGSAELASLWTLVVGRGLADGPATGPAIAPVTVEPDFDETVFVLVGRANGRRWSVVRRTTGPARALDPAVLAVVDRLAELSWLEQDPGGRLVPRRYDLGPDPWSRYRGDPDATP